MSLFAKVAMFALVPVLTMLVGSAVALIRQPGGNVRSIILHFAAGVVFSVVAVELLPDVIREHQPLQVVIGFILGVAVMIAVRKFADHEDKEGATITKSKLPMALLIGIAVDIFIDGLLLGIGFAAGSTEGQLLALALSVELLSLGIATAVEIRAAGISKSKTLGVVLTLSAFFFFSALLGALLLSNLSDKAMEVVLSFGLSALLFLVTEELLTEAHEEKETVWHTAAFFGGFLIFLILGMVA